MVHHYSALEEVLRCLRAPLQAGLMEEGVLVEGEVLVLVFHRIFVGPQAQETLHRRMRILVTLAWTLYATTTYQCRTHADVDVVSSRTVVDRGCAYIRPP